METEQELPPPSALPGISPSRGEIDLRRGPAHLRVREWKWRESTLPISPLEGEMPGRAEGGEAAYSGRAKFKRPVVKRPRNPT
ncbi:hypothetical protein EIQ31_09150 [Agrobacterium deltaense]|nr:hypothetical protein EIQ31_09150 [Agrobacterium deltaense]